MKLLVAAAFVLLVANPAPAQQGPMLVREIAATLGFGPAERDRLLAGEIISAELRKSGKKELSVALAMIVPGPYREVFRKIQGGELLSANRRILAHGDLPAGASGASVFAELRLDPREMAKLASARPGSDFNLSKPEWQRIAAADGSPAAAEAAYREILAERLAAYRRAGIGAVAPYDRGRKEATPGSELADALEAHAGLKKHAPDFYAALARFPDGPAATEHRLIWVLQEVQQRPTVVLSHRAFELHDDYGLAAQRHFYVGQSYNSLMVLVGTFPVGPDRTLVFYTNRTSTDQVGGMAAAAARKVGRKVMTRTLVRNFEAIREALGG